MSPSIGPHSAAPDFLDDPDVRPACEGADLAVFFPAKDDATAALSVARTYCAVCPLAKRCRAWALAQPPDVLHGIWGGLSRPERLRWHRARRP